MSSQLWTDERMMAAYVGAFERNPDVHHWGLFCTIRDDYEARIAALEAQLADTLALNKRNVDDAARIINANQGGLELAHISLAEWGKREQRIKELEAQLAEANDDNDVV